MRVELPKATPSGDRKAHAYPFQIGILTQQFLQGTIFHIALMDEASGRYVRQEGAIPALEKWFLENGLDQRALEIGWAALGNHIELFKMFGSMNVVVALNSQWDWYIRRLANFSLFALRQEGIVEAKVEKTLARLERRPILEQIAGIELATGVQIALTAEEAEHLKELSLVRNLALHNRWEVDEQYAKQSARNRWQPGEVREFDISEGYAWNRSLLRVLNALSFEVAQRFVSAPGYP